MSEVSALQPYLVGPDVSGIDVSEPDVDARALRGPDGSVILVAIARNGFTGEASIRLPAHARGNAEVLYEDRSLRPVAGRITDSFDGYEAHVYRYRAIVGANFGTGVGDGVAGLPAALQLSASPNPTTGPSRVHFVLPRAATVTFSVFDAAGRRVATLGRGNYPAGAGEVLWDGRDVAARPVSPGVYFVRASTSDGQAASVRILVRY